MKWKKLDADNPLTQTPMQPLPEPSALDEQIYAAALGLFEQTWKPTRPVRLLGVGVSHFEAPPARQLSLWGATPTADRQRLQQALDELQERYGKNAIRRGVK